MPRISIQQFRTTLAGDAREGVLVRAYRELTKRHDLAASVHLEWAVWPPAAQTAS